MEPAGDQMESGLARRQAIARRVSGALEIHPPVAAVRVFGSVASGHIDERSDVDILVVCREALLSSNDRLAILKELGTGWCANDGRNALFAAGAILKAS
jgi:predicted nucleotidyltransferase